MAMSFLLARNIEGDSQNDIRDIINSRTFTMDHIQFLEKNIQNREPMFFRQMSILTRRICEAREHIDKVIAIPGILEFIYDGLSRGMSISCPMASAVSWMLILCPEWGRSLVSCHPDIIHNMVKVSKGVSNEYDINLCIVLDKYSDIISIEDYVEHQVRMFYKTNTPYLASNCAIVLMKANHESVDKAITSYDGAKEISVGKRNMPNIIKFIEEFRL